jgi:archaemetzincin
MARIFIWWIGEAAADRMALDHVAARLAEAFRAPVTVWDAPERPRHAYDARRRQHASGVILRWLLEAGPSAGKVLGITDRDLFIPILTYVFGEAQLGGSAAVVSTARLVDGADAAGQGPLLARLEKEALHEIGHAFGLVHCGTPRCVMSRSAGVKDVDAKDPALCPECRARLEERVAGGP